MNLFKFPDFSQVYTLYIHTLGYVVYEPIETEPPVYTKKIYLKLKTCILGNYLIYATTI